MIADDSSTKSFWSRIFEYKSTLPCPGSFDSLQKEVKNAMPALFMNEGAKFDIATMISGNASLLHSFTWGNSMAPPSYHLGANYNTSRFLLSGQIDHHGGIMGRAHYNWIPIPMAIPPNAEHPQGQPAATPEVTSTSKVQTQLPAAGLGQKVILLEHEHIGKDFSFNFKATNPTLSASSPQIIGSIPETYGFSILQSLTPSLALGAEYTLPRVPMEGMDKVWSLALKYVTRDNVPPPPSLPPNIPSPYMPVNPKDPSQVFTATYSPSTGIIHSTFWRRLNQRLELVSELQLLVTGGSHGRREGVASIGFKMDTLFATLRSSIDTQGRVCTALEERIAPGVGLMLSGEMDYGKGLGGQGKIGIGFTMEF